MKRRIIKMEGGLKVHKTCKPTMAIILLLLVGYGTVVTLQLLTTWSLHWVWWGMSLLCVAMVTTVVMATNISMVTTIWDVVGTPGMLKGDGLLDEQTSLWAGTARIVMLKRRRRSRRKVIWNHSFIPHTGLLGGLMTIGLFQSSASSCLFAPPPALTQPTT